MHTNKLGEIIKKGRARTGISRAELARRLQISQMAVTNWEENKNYPAIPMFFKLIEELQLLPDLFPHYPYCSGNVVSFNTNEIDVKVGLTNTDKVNKYYILK